MRLAWRTHLAVLLAYALLACVMTYPLILQIGNALPVSGDTLKHTWRIGWEVHSLTSNPLALYQANSFYLYPDSFAYDDLMLTQGLMSLPLVLLTGNPVLAHNLVLLVSFALGAYTMFLYSYQLTRHSFAAWLAGLIFAFSTVRLVHLPHINLLTLEWTPLFFLGLDKMLYTRRRAMIGMTIAAGVLQALASLMVLYLVLLAALPYVLLAAFWRRLKSWQNLAQITGAMFVIFISVLPFALPYYRVSTSQGFVRDEATVEALAATLYSYASVPPNNWFLGQALAPFIHQGNFPHEHFLFLGLTAGLLGLMGLLYIRRAAAMRLLLAIGIIAGIISFGPVLYISATQKVALPFALPYAWLYDWLPGFSSLRAGSRFALVVMFALAGLAGFGALWLLTRVSGRWQIGLTVLGSALILLENGIAPLPLQSVPVDQNVPPVYRWLAAQPSGSPIAELPIRGRGNEFEIDWYQYLSVYHWQPLLTSSYFSYYPKDFHYILGFAENFPSPETVNLFREFGVGYVIVHWDRMTAAQRTNLKAQLNAWGLEPIQRFDSDWVFAVPRGVQDWSALHGKFYVPAAVKAGESVPIHVLVTNPTSEIYFFDPLRKISVRANDQTLVLPLPLFLEKGTTVLSTRAQLTTGQIQLSTGADSTIQISPQTFQVARDGGTTGARPIALEWRGADLKRPAPAQAQVILNWRVLDRVREPYIVELEARDASGSVIAETQVSHPAPVDLTSRWRPGEMLKDNLTFRVPPDAANLEFSIRLTDANTHSPLLPLDVDAKPLKELHVTLP